MAGRKLFTDATPYTLQVTLVVRSGADPGNTAGTKNFTLNANQSQWQTYGNNVDIYLNGIKLTAVLNGGVVASQYIVFQRGSALDNMFNTRNGVTFTYDARSNSFGINTKQVN